MKKLLFTLLLTCAAGYLFSQPLQQKLQGAVIDSDAINNPAKNIIINCRQCGNKHQKVLFFLDGVISDSVNLSGFKPNDIETIEIVKSALSEKLFGERAKDGAVIITLKEKEIHLSEQKTSNHKNNLKPAIRDYATKSLKQPLFIINGVLQDSIRFTNNSVIGYTVENHQILFAENIIKSELITDSKAAAIYGVLGANSVVNITTKED